MSLPDFAALNERRAEAGPVDVHEPAQLGRGHDPPAGPASSRPSGRCRSGPTRSASPRGLRSTSTGRRSSGCGPAASRSTRTSASCDSEDEVVEQCLAWERRRGSLDFEIDGVVVKVNDVELQRRLGVVGREPRWAIAWKFPPTTAMTKLLEIGWNPGKFGDLHPYAVLEPVQVGGVTIKLATLHNEEDLARKDIRAGEEVIVLRAGDVIPQVLVAGAARRRAQRPPAAAAARRSAARCATRRPSSPRTRSSRAARTATAPGRRWQLLKHFAGRDGHRRPRREAGRRCSWISGWVRTAGDFYRLTAEQIAEQPGFGEVSAGKLVAAIEASKRQPFGRVLFALGIEEVGYVTGRNLAQQFRTIDALLGGRRPRRSSRPRASARRWRRMIHDQLRRPADASADRRSAATRAALRGRGPAAGRGAAGRQDAGADRHAARADARAGDRADRRGRRPRHRLGVEEDRLCRRRRKPRLKAREGREAGRAGGRRGRLLPLLGGRAGRAERWSQPTSARTTSSQNGDPPEVGGGAGVVTVLVGVVVVRVGVCPAARSRPAPSPSDPPRRARNPSCAQFISSANTSGSPWRRCSSRRGWRRRAACPSCRGSRAGRGCRPSRAASVPRSPAIASEFVNVGVRWPSRAAA